MQEDTADRLIIVAKQVELLAQTVREEQPTPDDIKLIAQFLYDLSESGRDLTRVALDAIDQTEPEHPLRSAGAGSDVQVYLGHAGALLQAAQTFVGNAGDRLEEMHA
jgi:hypothetical protein